MISLPTTDFLDPSIQNAFIKYSNCKCCDKHQKNKPTHDEILNKTYVNQPFKLLRSHSDCVCPCRSNMRWIARYCCGFKYNSYEFMNNVIYKEHLLTT
jgi:hypothetical protein